MKKYYTAVYSYTGTETPLVTHRAKKYVEPRKKLSYEETAFLNDLYEDVYSVLWSAKQAPVIKKSKLDHGFYVFAIMRYSEDICQSVAIYIGTADGSSRLAKSIFILQRKFNGSSGLILATGLSKTQAMNVRRTLIRKLRPCENLR